MMGIVNNYHGLGSAFLLHQDRDSTSQYKKKKIQLSLFIFAKWKLVFSQKTYPELNVIIPKKYALYAVYPDH